MRNLPISCMWIQMLLRTRKITEYCYYVHGLTPCEFCGRFICGCSGAPSLILITNREILDWIIWQVVHMPIIYSYKIQKAALSRLKKTCDKKPVSENFPTPQSWTQSNSQRWEGKYQERNTMVSRTLRNNRKLGLTKSKWRYRLLY